MAALIPVFLNNVTATLDAVASGTTTSFAVDSGEGAAFGTLGTNEYIPAVVIDTSTSPETLIEYVYITGRVTDTLTVIRAAEDDSTYPAAAIASGMTLVAVTSKGTLGNWQPSPAVGVGPRAWGFAAWTVDPALCTAGDSTQHFSGAFNLYRMDLPGRVTVSSIIARITSGGSGLTSGQCFAGIYDSSFNLMRSTGDISSSLTGTGFKTLSLSSPVTVAPTNGFVYIAWLMNGTTLPALLGMPNPYDVTLFSTAAGSPLAINRWARSNGGNTSLPSTVTLGGGTPNRPPFFAVK